MVPYERMREGEGMTVRGERERGGGAERETNGPIKDLALNEDHPEMIFTHTLENENLYCGGTCYWTHSSW